MQKKDNIKKAVIFSFLAAICFSIMALFVKFVAHSIDNNLIVFFRFGVSFLYILGVVFFKNIISKKNQINLKTKIFKLHFLRAVASTLSMLLLYYSLAYISLVDANLLFMTSPLFVFVIGLIFLHKRKDLLHIIAVILGFIGVAFVLKPTASLFNPKAIYALLTGVSTAVAFLLIRKISKKDDHYVSLFYYFLLAFTFSGIISIFRWSHLDWNNIYYLFLIGVFGTAFQEFLIRASTYASAKITSSLLYFSVLFSAIFSFIFFNYSLGLFDYFGILLICSSGIIVVRKNNDNNKKISK
jgi:drug/metabolite transporter (DMT)-like permease